MRLPSAQAERRRDNEGTVPPRSYYGEAVSRLVHDPIAMAVLAMLVAIVMGSAGAPLLSGYNPLRGSVTERLLPVGTPGHILGTDEQGRDMLTRLLYGGRISLLTGAIPILVATVVGMAIGAVAAFVGRTVGVVLMRIIEMTYAFPAVILAIAVASSLGPGVKNLIIALSVVFIPPIARVAESATRQVVVQEYIEAARLSGASSLEIIVYHILPNIFSPIFVYTSGLVGLSIILASGLSFLGLGTAPPTPEWGAMLNNLRGSVYIQPVVVGLPGLFIFVTSVAFNLLSDSLRDALDVKRL